MFCFKGCVLGLLNKGFVASLEGRQQCELAFSFGKGRGGEVSSCGVELSTMLFVN